MRKTASQVESDIYALLLASELKTKIGGSIYKEGMRPVNAETEDAVLSFLAGLDGQIQEGVLNLNIYVKDIDNGERDLVRNITRLRELEATANSFIQGLVASEYRISLGSTIQSFKAEGIKQHFVNVKIKFELITF